MPDDQLLDTKITVPTFLHLALCQLSMYNDSIATITGPHIMSDMFDWDSLKLGPDEDPSTVKQRLDKIHRDMLEQQGVAYHPEKNSPGFRPTPEQARHVKVMACLGIDPKDIALVLNIEHKLLKLYYGNELKISANLANAMVARTALQMAMSGRSPDMTKFWLRARAGWNDVQKVDITSNGKTLDQGVTSKEKLRQTLEAAGAQPKKSG